MWAIMMAEKLKVRPLDLMLEVMWWEKVTETALVTMSVAIQKGFLLGTLSVTLWVTVTAKK
jgi:hypothetical protein